MTISKVEVVHRQRVHRCSRHQFSRRVAQQRHSGAGMALQGHFESRTVELNDGELARSGHVLMEGRVRAEPFDHVLVRLSDAFFDL